MSSKKQPVPSPDDLPFSDPPEPAEDDEEIPATPVLEGEIVPAEPADEDFIFDPGFFTVEFQTVPMSEGRTVIHALPLHVRSRVHRMLATWQPWEHVVAYAAAEGYAITRRQVDYYREHHISPAEKVGHTQISQILGRIDPFVDPIQLQSRAAMIQEMRVARALVEEAKYKTAIPHTDNMIQLWVNIGDRLLKAYQDLGAVPKAGLDVHLSGQVDQTITHEGQGPAATPTAISPGLAALNQILMDSLMGKATEYEVAMRALTAEMEEQHEQDSDHHPDESGDQPAVAGPPGGDGQPGAEGATAGSGSASDDEPATP